MFKMIRVGTKLNKVSLFIGMLCFMVASMTVINQSGRAASDESHYMFLPVITYAKPVASLNTFYISPNGNDDYSGKSEAQAWATFDRAWIDLYPGDTLILLDGVYYQTLNPNVRNGEPGKPITIRAKNDGKAVIDGQYQRTPVRIGDTWNDGPVREYFVIEGIVAKNSIDNVYWIRGDHNILRRVSGYNANTDENKHVFVIWANYNLIEDCVAAGTGRKMIMSYKSEYNVIRRCFAYWMEWDGRDFCAVLWPNGQSIQIYHGNFNIIENSIAIGPVPDSSISVQANSENAQAIGNRVLGSIAINAGINLDGTVKQWGDVRPEPNSCPDHLWDPNQLRSRSGFSLHGKGVVSDNIFQDILAWGNAGLGFAERLTGSYTNNQIDHATIDQNGIDYTDKYGGEDTDMLQASLSRFSITNSSIDKIFIDYNPDGTRNLTTLSGPGARLSTRYVDGVLTSEPLWPWPMEDRIQSELGISVTDMIVPILDISK